MKRVAFLATLGLLALSGAGVAALADTGTSSPNPAQQCRTEQADPNFATSHGGKTFAQFYGTNANAQNAYGKCVSAKAQAQSSTTAPTATSTTSTATAPATTTTHSTSTAAAKCRVERAADPAAFKAKYGTNKKKSNAFGKCVSKAKKHTSS